ncbi:SPOR domain-containing protein [Pseudomonas amygdali]|uniref:SPOR domain-containing protein n=1 Tax=Pseudomonas amygdali TaxID=47877 RepID=UPI0012498489
MDVRRLLDILLQLVRFWIVVWLTYTSTRRQAAHWHRVRLGPFSAFSDAEAFISMVST